MRTAGSALLGFLGGAAAGLVGAVLFLFLWFDVLGIGDHGGDGMSGMAAGLVLLPAMALAVGIGGAVWLGRKAAGGGEVPTYAVAIAGIALALGFLFFFGGGLFF
jgi:hypothetical protein